MLSRIPENALVTLLRKCYITPQCQALRQHPRRTSSRSLHTLRPCQHLRPRHNGEPCTRSDRVDGSRTNVLSKHGLPILPTALRRNNVQRRTLATEAGSSQSTPAPILKEPGWDRVAVIGGGITGLTSAHFLAKTMPEAKIDIYEGSGRLGGWLNSQRFDVGSGSIVFEQGPRTIRPHTASGMVTVQLAHELGLEDEIIFTSENSVAAQNRFVYYPDHLVRMPGPGQDPFQVIWSILTEPIYEGLFKAILEPKRPTRDSTVEDESVGSFLTRRFGSSQIGDNIASAVLHGIYGGDLNKLSVKSLLPDLWYSELHYGNLLTGIAEKMRTRSKIMTYEDAQLTDVLRAKLAGTTISQKMIGTSVYTFKKGISALSEALETSLRAKPNVQFKLGHQVNSIQHDNMTNRIIIKTTDDQPQSAYANVISTISGRSLSYLTKETDDLPSLQAIESATVMVVNLWYPDPDILPERGFGYLIPRSIPYEQNPECALGVVFDSDATIGQDEIPGTKLTVMLGGHWWDGFDCYPDEQEGEAMAKAVVKRHLGIDDKAHMVNVSLQKDCIPQYTVGHNTRMKRAHGELLRTFKGRLAVAGNSYTGVGLNDCIRGAMDVVACLMPDLHYEGPVTPELLDTVKLPKPVMGELKEITGLERFLEEPKWAGIRHSRGYDQKKLGVTQKSVTDYFRDLDSR